MWPDRNVVPDRRMRTILIIVSTPILHLFAGIRKRQEPVHTQALRPEVPVKCLDVGVTLHEVVGASFTEHRNLAYLGDPDLERIHIMLARVRPQQCSWRILPVRIGR